MADRPRLGADPGPRSTPPARGLPLALPRPHGPPTLPLACAVLLVGLYGGYFGAASGVLMLAVLSLSATEPLPVTNAVKNIATGAANVTAAVAYVAVAPVNWAAAVSLGLGALLGSWLGPAMVVGLRSEEHCAYGSTCALGPTWCSWSWRCGYRYKW
ncbi:hypothetical protein SANTM175S_10953 [Streptomyces antimycoticus]